MCDCKFDISKAKKVGRAHWVCPICGFDVSMAYVLYMQAVAEEERLENLKKKEA